MKILSGITNGQVLQCLGSRGAAAKLTGTSEKQGTVSATIFQGSQALKGWKKKAAGKAAKGKFSFELKGIPTGGPYRLRLEAEGDAVEVASFFVGDVWLLAGQSNMEGVGNLSGAAKSHPLIRAFSMRREWRLAADPLHLMPESPDICHHNGNPYSPAEAEKMRRTKKKGTGVAIFFAREMMKRSAVPQGLICTAHGGTSMEQWDPERKKLKGESLYFSMMESVRATGQPVAGMLWYQGESDANPAAASFYTERMQKLVAATRRDLRQPTLPWIIVQIARFFTLDETASSWNSIQEQQRLLPGKIKNLETVAAIDLPVDDLIHIGAEGCVTLGQRMARVADRMVYGNKIEKRPPQLREIVYRTGTHKPSGDLEYGIKVTFDSLAAPLRANGEADGFMLVAPSGKALPLIYKTVLLKDGVWLEMSVPLPEDAKLSYGHGYDPRCTITDARGYSLPVFGPQAIKRS